MEIIKIFQPLIFSTAAPNDELIQRRQERVSSCWSAKQVKGALPPLDGYHFFQLHHSAGMIMLEGIIGEKSRAWNITKWLFAESSQVHLLPDYHSYPRTESKVRLYIPSLAHLFPDYHKIQKRSSTCPSLPKSSEHARTKGSIK